MIRAGGVRRPDVTAPKPSLPESGDSSGRSAGIVVLTVIVGAAAVGLVVLLLGLVGAVVYRL